MHLYICKYLTRIYWCHQFVYSVKILPHPTSPIYVSSIFLHIFRTSHSVVIFASTIKHNSENSREEKPIVFSCFLLPCSFPLPDFLRFLPHLFFLRRARQRLLLREKARGQTSWLRQGGEKRVPTLVSLKKVLTFI